MTWETNSYTLNCKSIFSDRKVFFFCLFILFCFLTTLGQREQLLNAWQQFVIRTPRVLLVFTKARQHRHPIRTASLTDSRVLLLLRSALFTSKMFHPPSVNVLLAKFEYFKIAQVCDALSAGTDVCQGAATQSFYIRRGWDWRGIKAADWCVDFKHFIHFQYTHINVCMCVCLCDGDRCTKSFFFLWLHVIDL